MKRFHLIVGLPIVMLLCLLATGCAKFAKDLGEISKLHTAIVKEFGEAEDKVGVNLNNGVFLTVSFYNSPLNDKTLEDRAQRAEKTAALVKDHFQSIAKIKEIWVVFVRLETHFVFVHTFETVSGFGFDKDGQPLQPPSVDADPDSSALDHGLKPSAVYSPDLNQTDVMITGLQLQGNQNQGLTMAIYAKLRGDATGMRRADAPKAIDVDLASYSEKSLFPGEPKIQFVADGKVVFTTPKQFSTSKNLDGLFSESVSVEVPYAAFRRLVAGKKMTLRLGEHEYNFTDAQAESLRMMAGYVKD
jgi:hypothetical protein